MSETNREYPSLRAHLLGMLAIFAALFLGLTVYLYSASRSLFSEALQRELSGDLDWMASILAARPGLGGDTRAADSLCKAVSRHKGFRVTLIDGAGRVLGDSHVPAGDLAGLENHLHRPEFAMARESGWGHAWRYSRTLRMDMLYVARRLDTAHYLRMAAGEGPLRAFKGAAVRVFALFLGLFLASSLAVTWWISRKISSPLLHLSGSDDDSEAPAGAPLAQLKPPRWEAKFREASVLNRAFQAYVDELRKLAGEVEKQRDKLVAVLYQLEEGILIFSAEGIIRAANPSSLRLLGLEAPFSLIGKDFRDVLPQRLLVQWAAQAADPERPPVLHLDKGPVSPFDLLCHLGHLDLEGGEREFLLTLINITEFKHLDRVKSEFVANASHELKTPLSSIKGFAEALLEGAMANEKVREPFVRKIHNNALRLERMVQDLLSLSLLEANPVPKEPESLPLRGYVNAAANLHRHGLDSAGIRLENHVPEDLRLLMEPRDLELILNNLIGNAVKYNKPGGKIKVGVERGGKLLVYVKDTGAGIPEEMLPRIFERFYRADAARAQKEGTGLGLAIVKHAAHKYGMTVRAESVVGEGSRFSMEVPPQLLLGETRAEA